MLANLHLLFWLSLVPFATGWMGENHFHANTVAVYGAIMLASGTVYYILSVVIIRHHGTDSTLAKAVGSDRKSIVPQVLYAAAIPLAFLNLWVAMGIFVFVALMWLVPDRRIERALRSF